MADGVQRLDQACCAAADGDRMMGWAEAAVAGLAGGARQRATGFAVTVVCLLLGTRVFSVLFYGEPGQVPFSVVLFVLPLVYAFRGTRRLLDCYRWPVLVVQAVLTWVPFAIFGSRWREGIGSLLAGMVLLTVRADCRGC